MPNDQQPQLTNQTTGSSRRKFLKTSSVGILGAGLALQQGIAHGAYVKADETLKVGLVGCGGRGTGAAAQTLRADKNVKLVAMADVFGDQLKKSLANISKLPDVKDRVQVNKDHQFVGFDAYKKLIATDVDVVLLATPPHFRPIHLKECVDANKHVFVEKPVATDAAGIRSIIASTEEAKKKNLTIVSGLCWRYETGMQETIARIQNGAIGDITSIESVRFLGGIGKLAVREPSWTEMYYQIRNWYYFTWLSGDFITEQFIHELDKISWMMGEYPVKCIATGGRQSRTDKKYGHIFDHFSVIYEYANGTKYHATTRQQSGCPSKFHDIVQGTKGRANLMKFHIEGENPWRRKERRTVMHQLEHDEMYKAIRKGETINNGEYMAKSTLMGIMGRQAAYTGKEITWDKMFNSKENLGPDGYTRDSKPQERSIAKPGITRFF